VNFEKVTFTNHLINLIVGRVWIRGENIVALSLRSNYHVTVRLGSEKSTEISVDYSGGILLYPGGSDGVRSLAGFLIIAAFGDNLQNRIVGIISQRVSQ